MRRLPRVKVVVGSLPSVLGAVLVVVVSTGGCADDDLDLPAAPEAGEIAAVYEAPSGVIDAAQVDALAVAAQERLASLDADWLPAAVIDVLARLRTRLEQSGLPIDTRTLPDRDRPRVDAVLRVRRTCAGWADPPSTPDAAASGTLELTVVVEDSRLRPAIAARATACRLRLPLRGGPAVNAYLDGVLVLDLFGVVPAVKSDARVLVQVEGRLGREGTIREAAVDLRAVADTVEIRVPVPAAMGTGAGDAGEIVAAFGPGGAVTLRGHNGVYACTVDPLGCTPSPRPAPP